MGIPSTLNETEVSSTVSNIITSPSFDSSQYASLQRSVNKTLKSRIFLGRYVERRLVNEDVGYRDVVLLSLAEEELQKDLLEVRQSLAKCYPHSYWIGITDTEFLPEYKVEVTIWTEINDKPFGPFWFQIKSVQFRTSEAIIMVKCLHYITERFLELEPFLKSSGRGIESSSQANNADSTTVVAESINFPELMKTVKNGLSFNNVKDGVFFVITLFIALITGSFACVSYFGNFVLELVRELSHLVHNTTPLILGSLDFVSKIIGGFYILLAMIFKQTSPAPGPLRHIEYPRKNYRRSAHTNCQEYDDRDFD